MREWLLEHATHDVPLAMLVILMLASLWMLLCASRKPDGFVGRMLTDDNGKPSVLRLVALWGFNAATWVMMRDGLRDEGADTTIFATYIAGTFAAPVAGKFIEKWNGVVPWTKKE
jgi:hypothetical protein